MAQPPRGSVSDAFIININNGDVEAVKQLFRDSHAEDYELSPQRHKAVCATIRSQKLSDSGRVDIIRLLTCNIPHFDPHFEAGMSRKNVVQIAFDEGQYKLIPLLMHVRELHGRTVLAVLEGFKLGSDAQDVKYAIGLAEDNSTLTGQH